MFIALVEVTMAALKQEILIVDDDEAVRMSLSHILAEGGGMVRVAEDGLTALARIRERIPHILLSDLNMPGMSGFELLAVVRCKYPQIQVIAMSGAFSGTGIPPGVAADAFHEKGSSPKLLLNILDAMQHSECLIPIKGPDPLAPVWIPGKHEASSEKVPAIISCPECLRAFSITIRMATSDPCETTCVYCKVPIRYVSAPRALPGLLCAFPRNPGAAIPSPLSIPDYE